MIDLLQQAFTPTVVTSGQLTRSERRRIANGMLGSVRDYPQQWEMVQAVATRPRVIAQCGRRGGKTRGVGLYTLARMVAADNWSCVVVSHDLQGPTKNWLEPQAVYGAVDALKEWGLDKVARIGRTNHAIVSISLPWGSGIRVLSCGNEGSWDRYRGTTAHLWWIEEAQNLRYLTAILRQLVSPTLMDFGGHIVMTGTPNIETDSLFARRAQGKDSGWYRALLASWHNPAFGPTVADRWSHILDTCAEDYALSTDDVAYLRAIPPGRLDEIMRGAEDETLDRMDHDALRELFGRWISDAGLLVYPSFERTTPWRSQPASLHAALRGLPPGEWRGVIGYDCGLNPDPAAWVIAAWAPGQTAARVLWSETALDRDDHATLSRTGELIDACTAAGIRVQTVVCDFSGPRAGTRVTWDRVLRPRLPRGISVVQAAKSDRIGQIRAMNLDLGRARLLVQAGDPLWTEGRHLRWSRDHPGEEDKHRPVVLDNGATVYPGDHCLDALRYLLPHLRALYQVEVEPEIPMSPADRMLALADRGKLRGARRK